MVRYEKTLIVPNTLVNALQELADVLEENGFCGDDDFINACWAIGYRDTAFDTESKGFIDISYEKEVK